MKSNNPSSYRDKSFTDNVFLCVRVYVCGWGFFGGEGALQWGEKSYRADSSLDVGVVLTTITKYLCLPRTFVEDKNYLALCICFPATEG